MSFDELNTTWTLKQIMRERSLLPAIFALATAYNISEPSGHNLFVFLPALVAMYVVGSVLMLIVMRISNTPHADAALVNYCRNNNIDPRTLLRFTWYSYYGIFAGFLTLGIVGSLTVQFALGFGMPVMFIDLALCYVLGFIVARNLNKHMIARTRTNEFEIAAVREGYYNHLFDSEEDRQLALKVLEKRQICTVKGAAWDVKTSRKIAKVQIIGAIVIFIVALLSFHMLGSAWREEIAAQRVGTAGGGAAYNSFAQADAEKKAEYEQRAYKKGEAEKAKRLNAQAKDALRRGHYDNAKGYAAGARQHWKNSQ